MSVRTIFQALDILKTPTSKTTEPSLLIVLADIRLIVPPDRGPEVLGGPDRPFSVSKVGGHVSDGGGGVGEQATCVGRRSSPDHPGGGVAHGRVFWLDELHVVVDAAVDFVVFFSGALLLKGDSSSVDRSHLPGGFRHLFSVRPLGFSGSSQRWPERRCLSPCPAGT